MFTAFVSLTFLTADNVPSDKSVTVRAAALQLREARGRDSSDALAKQGAKPITTNAGEMGRFVTQNATAVCHARTKESHV